MSFLGNLEQSLVGSASSAVGAAVAVKILSADGDVPIKVLPGVEIPFWAASGGAVLLASVVEMNLIQPYLIPQLPDSIQPFASSASGVGQLVTQGMLPSAILWMQNRDAMGPMDLAKTGGVIFLGAAAGNYLSEKLMGAAQQFDYAF